MSLSRDLMMFLEIDRGFILCSRVVIVSCPLGSIGSSFLIRVSCAVVKKLRYLYFDRLSLAN